MTRPRKFPIEVRTANGKHIATIIRVLTAVPIGNFNPLFCRYRGVQHLVKSDAGDLSDPFRRDNSYLKSLHIVRN
jgi:hypothetical protein